jgi:hypothetical protein
MSTVLIRVLLAVLIGLLLGGGVAHAAPEQTYRTPWEPVTVEGLVYADCLDEYLDFTGYHMTQIRVHEDAAGGVHATIQDRVRGGGSGTEPGFEYRISEGFQSAETSAASGAFTTTFRLGGSLVFLNPSVPNMRYDYLLKVTLSPDGELITSIESFDIRCVGGR